MPDRSLDSEGNDTRLRFRAESALLKGNVEFRRPRREMVLRRGLKGPPMVVIRRRESDVEVHDQPRHGHTEVHQGERSAYAAIGACARKSDQREKGAKKEKRKEKRVSRGRKICPL